MEIEERGEGVGRWGGKVREWFPLPCNNINVYMWALLQVGDDKHLHLLYSSVHTCMYCFN